MKKFLFITSLLLSAAHLSAMDENRQNYQDPKPIVIKSVPAQHAAFAKKIKIHLNKANEALSTEALESIHNTTINLKEAYDGFEEWLNLFDRSNKEQSNKFIRPLRNLFVKFKEILNNEKVSGTEDYPAPIRYTFPLNLRIQRLADEYSN